MRERRGGGGMQLIAVKAGFMCIQLGNDHVASAEHNGATKLFLGILLTPLCKHLRLWTCGPDRTACNGGPAHADVLIERAHMKLQVPAAGAVSLTTH